MPVHLRPLFPNGLGFLSVTLGHRPTNTLQRSIATEQAVFLANIVCRVKTIYHRLEAHIEARLDYTAAMFNVCLHLCHQSQPKEPVFRMSIAEFSL